MAIHQIADKTPVLCIKYTKVYKSYFESSNCRFVFTKHINSKNNVSKCRFHGDNEHGFVFVDPAAKKNVFRNSWSYGLRIVGRLKNTTFVYVVPIDPKAIYLPFAREITNPQNGHGVSEIFTIASLKNKNDFDWSPTTHNCPLGDHVRVRFFFFLNSPKSKN